MFDMVLHTDPVFNLATIEPIGINQLELRFDWHIVTRVNRVEWEAMSTALTEALDRALLSGLVSEVQYSHGLQSFVVRLTR